MLATNGAKARDGSGGGNTGIKVIIRVRPLLPRELMDDEVVKADELASVVVLENDKTTLATSFDRVFGPRATQEDVFRYAEPDIKQVMGGFNTTMFAYGQTGTGKTFTMLGGDYTGKHYKAISLDPNIRDSGRDRDKDRNRYGDVDGGDGDAFGTTEMSGGGDGGSSPNSRMGTPPPVSGATRRQAAARGLIPRAADSLFSEIRARYGAAAASASSSCHVTCTYLEIYNESLFDLLEGSAAAANWKKASGKKAKGHRPDPFDIRALQRRQGLEIKEDPGGGRKPLTLNPRNP
jgi:hypothetical protein